jgi:hypothetical protein
MTIKLTEIYEHKNAQMGAVPYQKMFKTREVYVNPVHVVCLRADDLVLRTLQENADPLARHKEFTRVFINRGHAGIDLTVVGHPSQIEEAFTSATQKQLLKG